MTFGLFNSGPQTRCEFVRMKGPGERSKYFQLFIHHLIFIILAGKGFAEMAVTKPKDSGIETPTSEPGFCATDMWDSECEDELDEYYNYRHQRRLSDPSSNLNNYVSHGWKAKNPTNSYGSSKTRSENEGLDNLANEVSEIEAGDLRDGELYLWCLHVMALLWLSLKGMPVLLIRSSSLLLLFFINFKLFCILFLLLQVFGILNVLSKCNQRFKISKTCKFSRAYLFILV